jgi:hypothetical protein
MPRKRPFPLSFYPSNEGRVFFRRSVTQRKYAKLLEGKIKKK